MLPALEMRPQGAGRRRRRQAAPVVLIKKPTLSPLREREFF
jgi:hypothetical protein